MKKLFLIPAYLVFSVTTLFAQTIIPPVQENSISPGIIISQVVTPHVAGCNSNTPAFGENLGAVSFLTDRTWVVGAQTWSDAVTAANCQKTTFESRNEDAELFNADCRYNPGHGDFFSWCAVVRFENELCPAPWRVPTLQDFIDLDIALGGNGNNRASPEYVEFINQNYFNPEVWGCTRGGFSNPEGRVQHLGSGSLYWSQTEFDATSAYFFSFTTNGAVRPRNNFHKAFGFVVRCVR